MSSDEFVDAYSVVNGIKQRVPRHFNDDPVLGRDLRLTPSQRERDGDLGDRPNADSTVKEIDAWAESAEVDLGGAKSKDDKLVAIEGVFGPAPLQVGVLEVEPDPPAADPLDPDLVAAVDRDPAAVVEVVEVVEDPVEGGDSE